MSKGQRLYKFSRRLTGLWIQLLVCVTLLSATSIYGQQSETGAEPTPSPTGVSQQFVDDASRAFREVVELRSAVDSLKLERVARIELEARYEKVVESFKEVVALKDETIATQKALQERVVQMYEAIVKLQQSIIDKYANAILNPKQESGWKKFLRVVTKIVEKAADIATGVLIGRVL